MRRSAAVILALTAILILGVLQDSYSQVSDEPDSCKVKTKQYGNLRVETYTMACHRLMPFYWKNGVTQNRAEIMLRRLGINPISIITGGFNTNLPGLREPIDYVEIENKIVVGRSDFWPLLFEGVAEPPYIGITQFVFELPQNRRWAIASGPWVKIKNKADKSNFTVQFFGNDISNTPWLEYAYRRNGAKLILIRKTDHKKTWSYVHRRLVFDWAQRRAVFVNKDGSVFAIVKGRADAPALGQLMVMLGYPQAIMLDGGSATLPSAMNPVYLIVTRK